MEARSSSITIYSGPELYEALRPWAEEKKALLTEIQFHVSLLIRLARDVIITSSPESKERLFEAWLDFYAHFQLDLSASVVDLTTETLEEDFQARLLGRVDHKLPRATFYDDLLFRWMHQCEARYNVLAAEAERMSHVYPEYLEARRAGYEPRLGQAWLTFLGRITRSPYWEATIYPMDLPKINAALAFVVRRQDGAKFYFS